MKYVLRAVLVLCFLAAPLMYGAGCGTIVVNPVTQLPDCTGSGGGGTGGTIGGAVTGGTANYNLIVDGSGNLGQEQFLGAARFPALTGDATTSAGSLAVTVGKFNGSAILGNYAAGGGTANAQTVTLSPAPSALSDLLGKQICWLPSNANTGSSPTLAVNGLTATTIKRFTATNGLTFTIVGDIATTGIACAVYDGTEFVLQNPAIAPNTQQANIATQATVLSGRNAGLGGVTINLSTVNSGGLFPGVMNSTGSDWTNGLTRAGYVMAQSALQFGAGNANITHTVFTNGNEQIHTGAPSDAGGSQRFQVIGGIGATGEIVRGTTFTCSGNGCAPVDGGATAGSFTVTTTGVSTPVITMGDSFTAPVKFTCSVTNLTTANLIRMTSSTTTTATFSGVTVAGDTISFVCHAY